MGPSVGTLVEAITEKACSPIGVHLSPANGGESAAVVKRWMLLERCERELAHHVLSIERLHALGRGIHRFVEWRPRPRDMDSADPLAVSSTAAMASRARLPISG